MILPRGPRELVPDHSSIRIPKAWTILTKKNGRLPICIAFRPHDASSIRVDPRRCDYELDSPGFSSGNKPNAPFNLHKSVSVYTSTTVIIATTLVTAPSRTISTTSTSTSNTSITPSRTSSSMLTNCPMDNPSTSRPEFDSEQASNKRVKFNNSYQCNCGSHYWHLGSNDDCSAWYILHPKTCAANRRSTKPRTTDALESPTEPQPPPPVLPRPIPVKITPEPYTLKYQEAQGIAGTSLGPEQNSFIHSSVRIFTLDGRRIDELMERMHILETRLATERVFGGQASTELPPYYRDGTV
ncbi:hypothetical protein GGU10DRAFT_334835 [Lentinula aff. detonsa]|uniref:Uncharacterized protein n=1 Tax=Lentinula aff. detonsa TaxID=2804958 RepID=A0AA38KDC1_9AGAR|nr:hypothetical protein GGU10DRAFT_334835 [Lentinula aff. detonsa]